MQESPVTEAPYTVSDRMISIIMPVRNGLTFIHEAIESVLQQDHVDFELIIIDDGSDDYNYSEFCNLDRRIRVKKTSGIGVSGARNLGIVSSRGNYISFLDADDVIARGKLTAQLRFLESHPEYGLVYGHIDSWHPNAEKKYVDRDQLLPDCSTIDELDRQRSGWRYEALLCDDLIGMNTPLMRRETLNRVGQFREDMRIGEDHEFWIRVSRITPMACLNATVSLYRMHPQSTMRKKVRVVNYDVDLRRSALDQWGTRDPTGRPISMKRYRRALAKYHFNHGYENFSAKHYRVAFLSFFKTALQGHRLMKSLPYGLISLLLSPFDQSKPGQK